MVANAPGVVLPHHTDFGLVDGVVLPKADILRPAAIGSTTLCANVAAAIKVPVAMQELLYVHCLYH
jgi:hypothetical protein